VAPAAQATRVPAQSYQNYQGGYAAPPQQAYGHRSRSQAAVGDHTRATSLTRLLGTFQLNGKDMVMPDGTKFTF